MEYTTEPYHLTLASGAQHKVATCWQDLTLGQYDKILGLPADIDTYGIMAAAVGCTRLDIMELERSAGDELLEALGYLQVPMPRWATPTTVHLPRQPTADSPTPRFRWFRRPQPADLVAITPPTNLARCTFGQARDLAIMLEQYESNPGQLRLAALSIYLMPSYFGSYDTDLLPAMQELCKLVRLGEGLPLADFFILTMSALEVSTSRNSKIYRSVGLSGRLATKILAIAGRHTPWLVRLLGAMLYGWRQYIKRPGAK